ncbi:MAG: type II secretion system protein GspD, partial [Deltaproteobacteria bacterium]
TGPTRKIKITESGKDVEAKTEKSQGQNIPLREKKCRPLPPRVRIMMNFNEAEVQEIVQWISKQTCKNFIIGDNIRGGKITILSNTPVTAAEAYRAFLSALNVNNLTVVKVGNFYKIQMKRDASRDTIPTFVGEEEEIPALDQMVTRVLPLKYVDANSITGTIKQLTSKDGECFAYTATNTLIISDTGSNMHRLLKIIEQLDTPLGQEEIRVVQVEYAAAQELAQTLEELFGQKGQKTTSRGRSHVRPAGRGVKTQPAGTGEEEQVATLSKVLADERTNKLILVAPSRSFERIMDLIKKLDVPIPGEGQIQVVYLKHADAEELANTLTSLAQGTGARRPGTSRPRGGKKTTGPQKAAELFQGEVKVTADKATNSLVIVANHSDFKSLLKVIRKLDIPRRQVFVEAVIMEVNLDTSKDTGLTFHTGAGARIGGETIPLFFGTQFKAQGSNFNSLAPNISLLGFLAGIRGPELNASDSILAGIALPSFGVMLQALQTDSNVNVLSTPHILTSDNEEAEIKVGENIPIPAGYGGYGGLGSLAGLSSLAASSTSGATSGTGYGTGYGGYGYGLGGLLGLGMGAINRQEVGLTLKIKPQINEGDVIRLELEEELSEVKDTSNPLGPTTTKRSAKTVVEVQDQQTVVIGGLIRDKLDIGETKIPILGDIPVIGWFFRTRREQKTKTNLLLFLTPYVIEGPADFRAIFERKMAERREFIERFYGRGPDYKRFIDFRKRHGPLADIHLTLRSEMQKLENGGPGLPGQVLITPSGAEKTAAGTGDETKQEPANSSENGEDGSTGETKEPVRPEGPASGG